MKKLFNLWNKEQQESVCEICYLNKPNVYNVYSLKANKRFRNVCLECYFKIERNNNE